MVNRNSSSLSRIDTVFWASGATSVPIALLFAVVVEFILIPPTRDF